LPTPSIVLAVAAAGAVGATLRFALSLLVGARAFPWATLGINVVGCLLLALLAAGPWTERWDYGMTVAITVGLLGSFTTFSAFGYEAYVLWRGAEFGTAAWYVAASITLGLAAIVAGNSIGRALN
jgi:fluoride exporter